MVSAPFPKIIQAEVCPPSLEYKGLCLFARCCLSGDQNFWNPSLEGSSGGAGLLAFSLPLLALALVLTTCHSSLTLFFYPCLFDTESDTSSGNELSWSEETVCRARWGVMFPVMAPDDHEARTWGCKLWKALRVGHEAGIRWRGQERILLC